MKFEKKKGLWLLAVAGMLSVLVAGGCNPDDENKDKDKDKNKVDKIIPPTKVDLWAFDAATGFDTVDVFANAGQKTAEFGGNVVIVTDKKIYLSKDKGATFTGSADVKAPQVEDAADHTLAATAVVKVMAHSNGFVFVGDAKAGIVVTDKDLGGVVAYRPVALDGLAAAENIDDAVVSKNILVIIQDAQNTATKIPAAKITAATLAGVKPAGERILLKASGGASIAGSKKRLGVGVNGDVYVVGDQAAKTWHFKQASLKANDTDDNKAEVDATMAKLLFADPKWTALGNTSKAVSSITATSGGVVLVGFPTALGYIAGKPGTPPAEIEVMQSGKTFKYFWLDGTNVYVNPDGNGLVMIDPSTGKLSTTVIINKDFVKAQMDWHKKGSKDVGPEIGEDNVLAFLGNVGGNKLIVTATKGVFVGVKEAEQGVKRK